MCKGSFFMILKKYNMKYNITGIDLELSKKLKTSFGQMIKSNLKLNIDEQEKQLNEFKKNLNYCEDQIKLYVDKAMTEKDDSIRKKYEDQKIVFADNKMIWNISGFIALVSLDIKTIQLGMYFAESEWHKRFYARQICMIMYESSKDIFELLGKDFKNLISKRIDISPFKIDLKDIRTRLNNFKTSYSDSLCNVRK